jgi:hypothetical protein
VGPDMVNISNVVWNILKLLDLTMTDIADTRRLLELTSTDGGGEVDQRTDDAIDEIVSFVDRRAPRLLDGLKESANDGSRTPAGRDATRSTTSSSGRTICPMRITR